MNMLEKDTYKSRKVIRADIVEMLSYSKLTKSDLVKIYNIISKLIVKRK